MKYLTKDEQNHILGKLEIATPEQLDSVVEAVATAIDEALCGEDRRMILEIADALARVGLKVT